MSFSGANYGLSNGSLTLNAGSSGTATVNVSGGTDSISSLGDVGPAASDMFVSGSGDRLDLFGVIGGTGPLLKDGAGTLVLSGQQQHLQRRDGGQQRYADPDSMDGIPANSGLTINAGGTLIFDPSLSVASGASLAGRGPLARLGGRRCRGARAGNDRALAGGPGECGDLSPLSAEGPWGQELEVGMKKGKCRSTFICLSTIFLSKSKMTETLFDRNIVFEPGTASPFLPGHISVNYLPRNSFHAGGTPPMRKEFLAIDRRPPPKKLSVRTLDFLRGKPSAGPNRWSTAFAVRRGWMPSGQPEGSF